MSAVRALTLSLAILTGTGLLALGCEANRTGDDEHSTHGDTGGTDHTAHTDTGSADCSQDERADTYAVGLSKTGESVSVTFVSADPAPPGFDDNTWVVAITDLGGEPVDGATIVVTPWMPDHGHGTPVEAIVTPTANPGEYELAPINLFMEGLWEVSLDISAEGGLADTLSFGFCVQ